MKGFWPLPVAAFLAATLGACSGKQEHDAQPIFAADDAVMLKDNMPACVSAADLVRFAEHYSRKEYTAAWHTKPPEPLCASDAENGDRQRWTVLYVQAPLVAIAITKAKDYEQHLDLNNGRHKLTYFTIQDWLERAGDQK